jgi:hypothetical protein
MGRWKWTFPLDFDDGPIVNFGNFVLSVTRNKNGVFYDYKPIKGRIKT